MVKTGVKMARCFDVKAIHDKHDGKLRKSRHKQERYYDKMLTEHWNVTNIYFCDAKHYQTHVPGKSRFPL